MPHAPTTREPTALVLVASLVVLALATLLPGTGSSDADGGAAGGNAEPPIEWDERLAPYVDFVAEARGLAWEHPVAADAPVRRMQAAEQLVQRAQHLGGEVVGHLGLPAAAVGEEHGQPPLRHTEEAVGFEQHPEGGEHRAARRFEHWRQGKGQAARGLAAWRMHEPDLRAVRHQGGRRPSAAQ